jgi:prevent-host-death family protein
LHDRQKSVKYGKEVLIMARAAATDLAKNFGEWHEKAMREPIVITKHGRESAVLLSAETFQKLVDGYREVIPTADMTEALAGAVMNSEIPKEYRWEVTDEDVSDDLRGVGGE